MRILALDSSGMVATVAVIEDDNLLVEYTMNYKKTHSQTLLPMLDEICQRIELDLQTIDAIAIASGPGSFTGLRIGAATAKGLGLALCKPIVSVPTIEGLAYNLFGTTAVICPLMDARRNQVYTGLYVFNHGKMECLQEQQALSIDCIIERINEIGQEVIFLGDGVPVYKDRIAEKIKVSYQFAPAHLSKQRAGAIGVLGGIYYKEGRIEDAREHKPEYLRMSQAERERLEKQNKEQV
ncbi:MAG: tRNA (adenosine(37)-N6)-threonylcarbamoyltransferase complex dimerization subunit type 1 TsaB [Lachnospiraceae bacterium]|nr:tRNA (adenosine(37)-N6)-threonylcarbamoyltransferase complex dimerization subunit type 1 TsaB [Lachnospiraceae bacterium]